MSSRWGNSSLLLRLVVWILFFVWVIKINWWHLLSQGTCWLLRPVLHLVWWLARRLFKLIFFFFIIPNSLDLNVIKSKLWDFVIVADWWRHVHFQVLLVLLHFNVTVMASLAILLGSSSCLLYLPPFIWNILFVLIPSQDNITDSNDDDDDSNENFTLIGFLSQHKSHENQEDPSSNNGIQEVEISPEH